ncbi:hypothetical protein P691DRAFT_355849 [Macrolepiota fuliginosa MF-IS2]|uniref:Uncharacterized protein n=1 Tax=Macrolepiota fuliginosa MF-IS2 TaxID=1400762 RepID=A0A9P6C061_9AGAR|nr:hypothetical protein P691DRAFT_355849 [Macrolepiota fuliginosa MF-IS2]
MICSRPEWHLQSMLSNTNFIIICKRKDLKIYDREAVRDVAVLLGVGFDKIRKKYWDRLPAGWPPESCFQRIALAASGHLGFVSFMLKFVEDEEYDDPDGQLKTCVRFLGGDGIVGAINPLHALDLLYRQILSDIPTTRLPTTLRILGYIIFRPFGSHSYLSCDELAKLLDLDQVTFHRSLQNLHSVVDVGHSLRTYHGSFSDFLMDPNRSSQFCLKKEVVDYDFALQCLHWLGNDNRRPTWVSSYYICIMCGMLVVMCPTNLFLA